MTDSGLKRRRQSCSSADVDRQQVTTGSKAAPEIGQNDRGLRIAPFPQMDSANVDRRKLAASGEDQGLLDWNLATDRIYFSPRWISMLGCSEHQVGNTPDEWFRRVHPDDVAQLKLAVDGHLVGGPPEFDNQHRMLHKDGTYRWMAFRGTVSRNEKGESIRLAGSHADVTAEKVADALTGLPNRLLLTDRLTRSVELAKRRTDFLFAVLVVDLDRFASMNERFGQAAGDQLLIATARRLETCLRAGDTVARIGRDHVVARFGGDEFTILLDSLNEVGEARIIAERLLGQISAPFTVGGHEAYLTASIGIALSATGYRQAEEVLRDADIAVHRAKTLGRARCEIFDTAIVGSATAQQQLEKDLQQALSRQEFVVHYQPIVSLPSKRIAGFEALVRWNHPSRGTVSPLEFIPITERTGLIVPLGQWVLREACRQLKLWQESLKTGELWVSVNLSSVQFKQPSLAGQIGEALYSLGLEPGRLILELTETAVMDNPESALATLMQLRVMGARIALDDFGAGYSSLSYLRRLPVDFLKIDKSFIRKMGAGQDFAKIVRSMTDLAHQLGLHVIAEGIEDTGQLEFIESLNCEYGQGFLFSRPLNAENASELLKTGLPAAQQAPVENRGGEIKPPVVAAAPPVPSGARPEELAADSKAGTSKRWRAGLLCGLAALVLISTAGILGRLKYASSAGSAGPVVRVETETAQTPAPLDDPVVTSAPEVTEQPAPAVPPAPNDPPRKKAAAAVVKKPLKLESGAVVPQAAAPAPALTKDPAPPSPVLFKDTAPLTFPAVEDPGPPAPEPASQSFSVIHLHVIGNCKGMLNVTAGGLSYVSDKGKDSLTLTNGQYSYGLSGDRLVVKSGSKTYRFKPAVARDQQENQAQLKKIVQAISANGQGGQSPMSP